MKKLFTLFALLPALLFGQANVQKSTSTATLNQISGDLKIGSGRTFTIMSGGTLTFESGSTLNLLANQVPWVALNKTGSSLADLVTRSAADLSSGTLPLARLSGITTSQLSASAGILNAQLANSSVTIGSTAISLGGTSTTLAGLTSVTSTGFTGALTGNASTATALTTGRTLAITGDLTWTSPSFDGTGNVTAAGTLATVNANVGTFAAHTVNAKGLITAATALSGDLTTSGAVATLATVNANVGTFGSVTQSLTATVNAKGLITAVSAATVTPAVGSITGLGSGVATWLVAPTSANLLSAVATSSTGTGALVFGTGPTIAGMLHSASSITAASTTDLVLNGGSSGASLTLGQGASGAATFNRQVASTLNATVAGTGSTYGFFAGPSTSEGVGIGSSGTGTAKYIQSFGGILNLNPAGNNVQIGSATLSGTANLTLDSNKTSSDVLQLQFNRGGVSKAFIVCALRRQRRQMTL
jgi:hypothetical protein